MGHGGLDTDLTRFARLFLCARRGAFVRNSARAEFTRRGRPYDSFLYSTVDIAIAMNGPGSVTASSVVTSRLP